MSLSLCTTTSINSPSAVLCIIACFFFLFFQFVSLSAVSALCFSGHSTGPENFDHQSTSFTDVIKWPSASLFAQQRQVKWVISKAKVAAKVKLSVRLHHTRWRGHRQSVQGWLIKEEKQEVDMWLWLKDGGYKVVVIIHPIHSALIYHSVTSLSTQSLFPYAPTAHANMIPPLSHQDVWDSCCFLQTTLKKDRGAQKMDLD